MSELKTLPMGIRNNNPGNIIHIKTISWRGEIPNDSRYCMFGSAQDGLRALAKQLWVYQNVHGCKQVQDFVREWAPPNENDTAAYVLDVCNRLTNLTGGKKNYTATTLYNINTRPQIDMMMVAIIWHENGQQPYSLAQIDAAIEAAGEWANAD